MPDNSAQNGTDTIRDLARQAGTIKTQVMQLDIGGATGNAEVLITAGQQAMAASMPVVLASNQTAVPITGAIPANTTTSGTLSATDAVVGAPVGDGTLIVGTSTAGSVVAAVVPDGMTGWTLLIKGYVSGTIYTEASNNSTNGTDGDWVEVKGRRTGTTPGTESVLYAMVANGYYRGNAAGFKYIRARLIGGTGPTIQWVLSVGQGATFLNSGIPGGTSSIGGFTAVDLGVMADAAASSDAGTFSLIALFKRLLAKVTTQLPAALGNNTSAASLGVSIASDTATGNITTQNLVPAGVATAGSAVEITLAGATTISIQTTNTYTGPLSLQATVDSTNWITIGSTPLINVNTGGYLATITSALQSVFQADVAGFTKARITGLAAMTGTATVTIRSVSASGLVALDTSLPTGTNSIGNLGTVSTVTGVTTVSTLTTLANGQTAHSSASTGSPVRVAGRVNTAVDTTLVAGDASDFFMTSSGAVVQKPFSAPELDWSFASAAGGITNTTDVVLKAAGAAGVRNYITGLTIQNASATTATEVVVKDGATVIGRWFVGAQTLLNSVVGVAFPSPLKGTAATALNVACITTAAAVYVNAQGYQAP